MRRFFTLALVTAALGIGSAGLVGCDGGGGGEGGSGNSGNAGGNDGGSGGGTTSSTTTGTTTTTTTTIAPDCTDILNDTECATCVEGQCCIEITECLADGDCETCLTDPNANSQVCAANDQWIALNDCAATLCQAECSAPPLQPACDAPATSPSNGACVTIGMDGAACNPITNEGCDGAAGEACDIGGQAFQCYPSGNVNAICEECGANDGDFCQPGMSCVTGHCARYCCEDTDCGAMGKCTKGGFAIGSVGVCEAL